MPSEVGVSQLAHGSTSSVSITRTVASGSGLIACGWADSGGALSSGNLTDDKGNAWTLLGISTQSFAAAIALWVCPEAESGSTTVTLTPDNASDECGLFISEFTGADSSSPVDDFALLFNTGLTTTPSPGSLTTTSPNDLVFGYLLQNYENVNYTAGSGFSIEIGGTGSGEFCCEVATVGAAGTYPVNWTASDSIPPAVAAVAIRAQLAPVVANILNCLGNSASTFDTGVVTIDSTSKWIQVGVITLGGGKDAGLLTLNVGSGGALGHFKLTRADAIGGTHIDWMVDSDFNTPTEDMPSCIVPNTSPANIYQLSGNGTGQIKLAKCLAIGEVGIWAKAASTDTTLQVTGCFSVKKLRRMR